MNATVGNFCSSVSLNGAFLALSISTLITSVVSMFLNSFLFYLLHKSRSFHSNVRLLLKNFILSECVFSSAVFGRIVYNIYVWRNGLFQITSFDCSLTELVWDLSATSGTHSIFFIAAERIVTTILKKRFDDIDRPSSIAYSMIGISLASSFGASAFLVSTAALENPGRLCYCNAILAIPFFAQFIIGPAYVVVESTTIVSYLFLYRHSRSHYLNFTINTTRHSLVERHRLINNMEMTKLLAPTMLIHGVTYVLVAMAFSYIKSIKDIGLSIDFAVGIVFLMSVETCVHPILLLSKHKKMRQKALDIFQILKQCLKRTSEQAPATAVELTSQPAEANYGVNFGLNVIAKSGVAISTGVVDFRVKPEQNDNILHSLWERSSPRPRNER